MKNKTLLLFPIILLLISCDNPIKSNETVYIEPGTDILITDNSVKLQFVETKSDEIEQEISNSKKTPSRLKDKLIGSWVGYFEKDTEKSYDEKKDIQFDEYYWNRENKINLSIDSIQGTKVIGHSVVAGNNRPFAGKLIIDSLKSIYSFEVREPGDDKYDGEFKFNIFKNRLEGKWVAYKNIDIKKRKYKLKREYFEYDSSFTLESSKRYVDWSKSKTTTKSIEDEENWVVDIYSTSTEKIYEINASSSVLTKEIVENLSKGDLKIIRNTIYARHGYSYKNRDLRVFFDAQSWYIPVHTDIRKELSDIEKKNIQLLLKYEKNAVEYYDYFGRG